MVSLGQKRGTCDHIMALFDAHFKCVRCREGEGQVLQGGLFKGFKGSLCRLVQYQGEVPGGDAPSTLGSVSVETIHETGEILIFADINGKVSQLVSNC